MDFFKQLVFGTLDLWDHCLGSLQLRVDLGEPLLLLVGLLLLFIVLGIQKFLSEFSGNICVLIRSIFGMVTICFGLLLVP